MASHGTRAKPLAAASGLPWPRSPPRCGRRAGGWRPGGGRPAPPRGWPAPGRPSRRGEPPPWRQCPGSRGWRCPRRRPGAPPRSARERPSAPTRSPAGRSQCRPGRRARPARPLSAGRRRPQPPLAQHRPRLGPARRPPGRGRDGVGCAGRRRRRGPSRARPRAASRHPTTSARRTRWPRCRTGTGSQRPWQSSARARGWCPSAALCRHPSSPRWCRWPRRRRSAPARSCARRAPGARAR